MTLLQAIVLGIVQGLTEFLPVSSTAHLRIVPALFGWHFSYNHGSNDPGAPFSAIIQLGTTIAIVVYFYRELLQVTVAWFKGLTDRSVRSSLEYKLGWYLILATVPVSVFGLIFSDQITTGARNLWIIAVTLIALAVILYAAEKVGSRRRGEEQITAVDAAVVGTAQALSLIPGASRSGTTITAGLFRGLTREAAARFSFLLSIPAVVLSGVYEAVKPGAGGSPGVGLTGIALVFAFVVGIASIHWLLRWLTSHTTFVFIFYRIALGVLLIVLLSTGVLSATH
ncbi:undecaprenyl-diphosphate phosphatase [Jatrophihabitans endophyticus]|uniref:undecaprenyl-diphosphate phosphatase n=1 Tax=Jatrophihabitans endophyticus TaxID=1206085 RepID=UPI0019F783F7|nr:undecaprenyl-diphosphate phosphatase [Jatrophihabitans endophyticus]MBE7187661.1 undecaprenyl-diphosphate phosphatase [Jatrophihabitans endophyticus]